MKIEAHKRLMLTAAPDCKSTLIRVMSYIADPDSVAKVTSASEDDAEGTIKGDMGLQLDRAGVRKLQILLTENPNALVQVTASAANVLEISLVLEA